MLCERCRFALWDKTSNGRRHPSGDGRCTWTKTFRIAGSAHIVGLPAYQSNAGRPFTAAGGRIHRATKANGNRAFPTECAVFQEMSN